MHELRSAIFSGTTEDPINPSAPKRPKGHGASLTTMPVRRTESRVTNQRRADRLPGVMDTTRLIFRRRKYDARVLNVSSGGVMLDCPIEPRIGEAVSITLEDNKPGKCLVRWIRGNRIGLEFNGFTLQLGQSESGDFVFRRAAEEDRPRNQRAPRQNLVWLATITVSGESLEVKLRNVSSGGALLECATHVAPNTPVLLDLSGAGMTTGRVRWCEGGQIGLQFDRELDLQSFSNVASQAAAYSKIDWLKPDYLGDELSPASPWAARWERLRAEDLG